MALKSKSTGIIDFYLIIDDILEFVNLFDVVVWSVVKRSGNKVGYMMVHFQHVEFGYRCWADSFPDTIIRYAALDLLNLFLVGGSYKKNKKSFTHTSHIFNFLKTEIYTATYNTNQPSHKNNSRPHLNTTPNLTSLKNNSSSVDET